MAPKKTENGQEFSASAFLVVPDPEQPSTWKLRIEEMPGKVTVRQLGRAASALVEGFRGVHLPQGERIKALSKLREAFRAQSGGKDELPSVLQQALLGTALQQLRRDAPALLEAVDGKAEVKAQLAGHLEALQESMWLYGLAAMLNGTLSFETVTAALQEALEAMHRAEYMQSVVEKGAATSYVPSCPYKVLATFPGVAIYCDDKGKSFQVSYHMEGTQALLEGDHEETIFTPVTPPTTTQESVALIEARPIASIKQANLNRELGVIEGTTLIGAISKNKRRYSTEALKKVAAMAEGLPAYVNHVKPEDAFKPRDVRDLIGRHQNVRFVEDGQGPRVVSDLHLLEHQRPWVFSLAERLGDVVGNSLVSRGYVAMEGDTEVVKDIAQLRSADLVSDPASTKGLFESEAGGEGSFDAFVILDRDVHQLLAEATGDGSKVQSLIFNKAKWDSADAAKKWARNHGFSADKVDTTSSSYRLRQAAPGGFARMRTICLTPKGASGDDCRVAAVVGFTTTRQEGSEPMELKDVLAHLKEHADDLTVVATQFGYVVKADHVKLQESVTALTTERDGLKGKVGEQEKALTEAKVKLDGFEAKDALVAKRGRLTKVISEHKLTTEFGKIKEAVTDEFRTLLEGIEEERWPKLLDDRYAALKGVPAAAPGPQSRVKDSVPLTEGENKVPEGAHLRLLQAAGR